MNGARSEELANDLCSEGRDGAAARAVHPIVLLHHLDPRDRRVLEVGRQLGRHRAHEIDEADGRAHVGSEEEDTSEEEDGSEEEEEEDDEEDEEEEEEEREEEEESPSPMVMSCR